MTEAQFDFRFVVVVVFETDCKAGSFLTSCSDGKVIGLVVFELFAFIWTSAVCGNVVLSTLAGGPYGCTF